MRKASLFRSNNGTLKRQEYENKVFRWSSSSFDFDSAEHLAQYNSTLYPSGDENSTVSSLKTSSEHDDITSRFSQSDLESLGSDTWRTGASFSSISSQDYESDSFFSDVLSIHSGSTNGAQRKTLKHSSGSLSNLLAVKGFSSSEDDSDTTEEPTNGMDRLTKERLFRVSKILSSERWQNIDQKNKIWIAAQLIRMKEHGITMKLLPSSVLINSRRIPHSSEELTVDALDVVKSDSTFMFISDDWLRPKEDKTDDQSNTKANALAEFILTYRMNKEFTGDPNEIYVWIDYSCVNQDFPGPELASTPLYIACCKLVVTFMNPKMPGTTQLSNNNLSALAKQYISPTLGLRPLYQLLAFSFMKFGDTPWVLTSGFKSPSAKALKQGVSIKRRTIDLPKTNTINCTSMPFARAFEPLKSPLFQIATLGHARTREVNFEFDDPEITLLAFAYPSQRQSVSMRKSLARIKSLKNATQKGGVVTRLFSRRTTTKRGTLDKMAINRGGHVIGLCGPDQTGIATMQEFIRKAFGTSFTEDRWDKPKLCSNVIPFKIYGTSFSVVNLLSCEQEDLESLRMVGNNVQLIYCCRLDEYNVPGIEGVHMQSGITRLEQYLHKFSTDHQRLRQFNKKLNMVLLFTGYESFRLKLDDCPFSKVKWLNGYLGPPPEMDVDCEQHINYIMHKVRNMYYHDDELKRQVEHGICSIEDEINCSEYVYEVCFKMMETQDSSEDVNKV